MSSFFPRPVSRRWVRRCLLVVACSSVLLSARVPDKDGYLAEVTRALSVPWPDNRTVRIVCHGHSVPAGYARTPEVRALEAYPHRVYEGLGNRFPMAVINVIVTAIGGENSEGGLARFETDVLALRPDVVTIDYALNDRRIGLERSERAWRGMIEASLDRGVRVILLTPTLDERADLGDPADPLHRHAEQVRALAAEYGVALVDSLAVFERALASGTRPKELLAQSNHPNSRGHELVAAALLDWFPTPSFQP